MTEENLIKFKLNDNVKIKELSLKGRVISIWITETGIKYEVRYFVDSKIETCYFYEDEIKAN